MSVTAGKRVVVIDAVRIFASFQMVQGHTIDALLDPRYLHGRAFELWSFLRGLTSVAFLFAAGLAFYLTTLADLPAHLQNKGAVRHRFTRALTLIALGYLLHLPRPWLIADILQCIGISLAALELVAVASRKRAVVVAFAVLCAAVLLGIARTSSHWMPSGPSAFVTAYFTQRGGSVFPLAPWGSYLFVGVVTGAYVLREGLQTTRRATATRMTVVAAAFLLLSFVARSLGRADIPSADLSFCLQKLALVAVVASVLAWTTLGLERLPKPVELVAGETLSIYVFHLLLLYGADVGLTFSVGHVFGPMAAICAALTMCALSVVVGLSWSMLKARFRPKRGSSAR